MAPPRGVSCCRARRHLGARAGCASVEQRVSPVSKVELKQICIIENPRVRQMFLAAMQDALWKRGFEVRMLPENTSHSACPLVGTTGSSRT